MKKTAMYCAMALAVLATLYGCKSKPEITALVHGDKTVAVEIEYEQGIDPASVAPEAFQVNGEPVAFAKAVDAEHVVLFLKGECKMHECQKADSVKCAEGEKACADCKGECKGEGEKACADCKGECKGEGEKACADCKGECKGEGEKACADCKGECKGEGEKACADCKGECKGEGEHACADCKGEGKAECKGECEKDAEGKCKDCKEVKLPVPEISVQQIADLKTADGKVVKAWTAPLKAKEAKPFKPGHKHKNCK